MGTSDRRSTARDSSVTFPVDRYLPLLTIAASMVASMTHAQAGPPASSSQDPRAGLRNAMCGSQTVPTGSEIPSIGCFTVASGRSASGMLDGHRFVVTVDARGEAACRVDGASTACTGCIDKQTTRCEVKLFFVDRNSDKSVLFNVGRRADGDRYINSREIWDGFIDLQQSLAAQGTRGAPLPPMAAPPLPPPPLPGLGPGGSDPSDGPAALTAIGFKAQGAYSGNRFSELDEMIDRFSQSDQLTDDGMPREAGIASGLIVFMEAWNNWQSDLDRIAQWRKARPNSYGVDIVEALIWRTWAWHARGGGDASTVTPEGWKLFEDRLRNADQTLQRCEARASKSPLWYQLRLAVARDMGWDRSRYQSLFDEATRRFPWYVTFYYSMTQYLSPKWHGTYEDLDQFARGTAAVQPGSDFSLYTRIYWRLTEDADLDFEPFRDSRATWSTMKQGFEGLMRRYPKSAWILNGYASFACRADDATTYGELRARVGQKPYPEAWPTNHSIEVCDARLLTRT